MQVLAHGLLRYAWITLNPKMHDKFPTPFDGINIQRFSKRQHTTPDRFYDFLGVCILSLDSPSEQPVHRLGSEVG